jgi:alpha-galactosidase
VDIPADGNYTLYITYATGEEVGCGRWLQFAVNDNLIYDDFLPATESTTTFIESTGIAMGLSAGSNRLRLMNHRRQENTLNSYAALLDGLNKADSAHDIIFSICEWCKTQPQNWGYKVGDSWRILNDITFQVGADGDPGKGRWYDEGTPSVTSQYNKCVVMDGFAGLDKGWNDPDMMMIGMDGLNETICKTHMAMWCMMNSPLMLGLDLRRVEKDDSLYNIIANQKLISLNQDTLGIQAKRVFTTMETETPDTDYITNHNRCDILAKPLENGDVALCFINVNDQPWEQELTISVEQIIKLLGHKITNAEQFAKAKAYEVTDLWTNKITENTTGCFTVTGLAGCDSVTVRVKAV